MVTQRSGVLDGKTVLLLEQGERIPRIDTVEKLAYALGLSPAFLAYGLEFPFVRSNDGFWPMAWLRDFTRPASNRVCPCERSPVLPV